MAASVKSIQFEGTAPNVNGRKRSRLDLTRVPVEVSVVIYDMAEDLEYQHGTGCSCNKSYDSDICPGDGVYHISKIADELDIDEKTVHMYLDDEYRFEMNEKSNNYHHSEIGKKKMKEWQQSKRGRQSQKRGHDRYRSTEHGKLKDQKYRTWYNFSEYGKSIHKAYKESEKGKEVNKTAGDKYKGTEKGIEKSAVWDFITGSSLMPRELNLDKLEECKWSYIDLFNTTFDAGIELKKKKSLTQKFFHQRRAMLNYNYVKGFKASGNLNKLFEECNLATV
ncbi:MAG: hypothetical protein GOV02_02560 [Candidatus Aenigmarchaeota archaeon]|nr:hypothetical protein [Candidatus Aenigmarchaeota archaeon]